MVLLTWWFSAGRAPCHHLFFDEACLARTGRPCTTLTKESAVDSTLADRRSRVFHFDPFDMDLDGDVDRRGFLGLHLFTQYLLRNQDREKDNDQWNEEDGQTENDWNLNIPRYLERTIEEETLTVAQAMENLKRGLGEAYAAEDRFKQLLQKAGFAVTVAER